MLIRPDLRAIPFAPVSDEGFDALDKALRGGGKIARVTYRIAGSPRPGEPKMDVVVSSGGTSRSYPVLYGPRTLKVLESNNVTVENL